MDHLTETGDVIVWRNVWRRTWTEVAATTTAEEVEERTLQTTLSQINLIVETGLEKLQSASLFPYNITPIIRLLERVQKKFIDS